MEYDAMQNGGFFSSFGQANYNHFDDIFSSMFGGNPFDRYQNKEKRKSGDPVVNFKIPLSQLEKGSFSKTIKISRSIDCEACSGRGGENLERCFECNGLGQIFETARTGNTYFQNVRTCGRCAGRGNIIKNLCVSCNGLGSVESAEEYNINVHCTKNN